MIGERSAWWSTLTFHIGGQRHRPLVARVLYSIYHLESALTRSLCLFVKTLCCSAYIETRDVLEQYVIKMVIHQMQLLSRSTVQRYSFGRRVVVLHFILCKIKWSKEALCFKYTERLVKGWLSYVKQCTFTCGEILVVHTLSLSIGIYISWNIATRWIASAVVTAPYIEHERQSGEWIRTNRMVMCMWMAGCGKEVLSTMEYEHGTTRSTYLGN